MKYFAFIFFKNLLIILLTITSIGLFAQKKSPKVQKIQISKSATYSFNNIKDDYFPALQNYEMPNPASDRGHLLELKNEIRKKYPLKTTNKNSNTSLFSDSVLAAIPGHAFNGNLYNNKVPNDNNLAISNDGMLISVINSTFIAYNTSKDSAISNKSLASIAQPLGIGQSKFDPKILYDPQEDKFILVFLNDNKSASSYIIIGFSSSSNPTDPWNMYKIYGCPFNDSTWSDYPAIAITENELFITMNQVKDGQPWQTAFTQSVIWQIDKTKGFAGDTILKTQLWSGINFGDRPIRNLNPIGGGSKPHGPNMYFLSNRNFDIQNDTIFLVEVPDTIGSSDSILKITALKSNVSYGMPPLARQASNQEFDTNDSRVLGGFLENNAIQFVSNTIDTTTGFSAIFHGVINNVDSLPVINATIIGDNIKDFGYPNISYTGKQACDIESIITFEHTSPVNFAGVSACFYSNDEQYAPVVSIKNGLNYVDDFIAAPYNRWGDYTGSQRKYNQPGRIWVSATYGAANKNNATWISEIISPDSSILSINENITPVSYYSKSDGTIEVLVEGGTPPYTYGWNNSNQQTSSLVQLKAGDYMVTVTDSYNCILSKSITISQPEPENQLFPNPTTDFLNFSFTLETSVNIKVIIYDMQGNTVKELLQENAKQGHNVLSFSTLPLSPGSYVLKITAGENNVFTEKFIKTSN